MSGTAAIFPAPWTVIEGFDSEGTDAQDRGAAITHANPTTQRTLAFDMAFNSRNVT
jgi:hypothetical protein